MQIDVFLNFLFATAIVVVIPGPNILLIVNNSIQHGAKNGCLTALGSSAGMIPLFTISLAGVSTLLIKSPLFFEAVRFFGTIYLVYLGVSMAMVFFRPKNIWEQKGNGSGHYFLNGMFISMTNPKGLLFAAAFFPQFLEKSSPIMPQVLMLVTGCLFVASAIGSLYAAFASRIGLLMQSETFNRYTALLCGTILVLFGLGFMFAGNTDLM